MSSLDHSDQDALPLIHFRLNILRIGQPHTMYETTTTLTRRRVTSTWTTTYRFQDFVRFHKQVCRILNDTSCSRKMDHLGHTPFTFPFRHTHYHDHTSRRTSHPTLNNQDPCACTALKKYLEAMFPRKVFFLHSTRLGVVVHRQNRLERIFNYLMEATVLSARFFGLCPASCMSIQSMLYHFLCMNTRVSSISHHRFDGPERPIVMPHESAVDPLSGGPFRCDEMEDESHEEEGHVKDRQDCVICLSPLVVYQYQVRIPSCQHVYHAHCLFEWLYIKSRCPLCRCLVKEKDVEIKQILV